MALALVALAVCNNEKRDHFSLREHQTRGVHFLDRRHGSAGLFCEMGTGKSRIALAYLAKQKVRRILIVCPLSVIGTWKREINENCHLGWNVLTLSDVTIKERAELLKQHGETMRVVLVNYESYWRSPLREAILAWGPEAVVLDEAHRIKRRTTKQAKFAHVLADRAHVALTTRAGRPIKNPPAPMATTRLALTGTPITRGPEDLWSIYRFINPEVFGPRWADFENEYCIMGGYNYKEITGYRKLAEIKGIVEATSYQVSKSEAFELPSLTEVIVPVELDKRTRKIYDDMRKHYLSKLDGVDEDGNPLTGRVIAKIALTAILRLQQITSGFVAASDMNFNTEIRDISSEKLGVCHDLMSDTFENKQKCVVFTRFRHDIERLILPHENVDEYGIIAGGVSQKYREYVLNDFLNGDRKVIYSQIKAGSLGINEMVAASIGIYYSTGVALDDWLQSKDRLHRQGQTQKVTLYVLLAKDTVDETTYAKLQDKTEVAGKIVTLDYARSLLA